MPIPDSAELGDYLADALGCNMMDGTLTRYCLRANTIALDLLKEDEDISTIGDRMSQKAVELVTAGESFLLGYVLDIYGQYIEEDADEEDE